MVDLSKLSAAASTQHVKASANSVPQFSKMTFEQELKFQQMCGKKVTDEDIDKAMNEPSGRNAVIGLVKRSPLGFQQPTAETLCNNGYMVSANGDGFTGPGGYGEWGNPGEDGSVNMTYKNGKFEQNMVYDKNGQVQSGTLIIRDDFGNIERQLDFIMNEDGKMSVVQ